MVAAQQGQVKTAAVVGLLHHERDGFDGLRHADIQQSGHVGTSGLLRRVHFLHADRWRLTLSHGDGFSQLNVGGVIGAVAIR